MSSNFTKFRILALGTASILLLWYFLDIDFSNFDVLKKIPKIGEKSLSILLSILLLFFISEIYFEYFKVKKEERLKEDKVQALISTIYPFFVLLTIYPKLVSSTFLSVTNRYDAIISIFFGLCISYLFFQLVIFVRATLLFKKIRNNILKSQLLFGISFALVLLSITFYYYYLISGKDHISYIFNNSILAITFIVSYYIFNKNKKIISTNEIKNLSKLSDDFDRSEEINEHRNSFKDVLKGGKIKHKKVMKHINKLKRNKHHGIRFEVKSELKISFENETLKIKKENQNKVIITATFYDKKTKKVNETQNISYYFVKLSIDELNKTNSFKNIKKVNELLDSISYKALELLAGDDYNKNLEILYIVNDGTLDQLKTLFKENTVEIDYQAENGYTALNLATANGEYEKVRYLLQKAANPNIHNKIGATPLGFAAMYGKKNICSILLEYGAEINYQDVRAKETPLMKAANQGHTDIAKLLIDNGANIDLVDSQKKTALDHATEGNYGEIAKMLRNR